MTKIIKPYISGQIKPLTKQQLFSLCQTGPQKDLGCRQNHLPDGTSRSDWHEKLPSAFSSVQVKPAFLFALLLASLSVSVANSDAAENLRLREGLSYVHDLDKGFPIIADKVDDVAIENGKATIIFFGAAGDLNTNRQAKRVVDLYKKYKDGQMKFIIVDVDHVSTPESKQLIKNYYQGYIPQEVILDKHGKTFWTHIGEVDASSLAAQLDKVLQ